LTAQIGEAHTSLAQVLALSGRPDEQRAARERALALYEQKGHRPRIEQTRALLAELRS
jgi:hypothetical protein